MRQSFLEAFHKLMTVFILLGWIVSFAAMLAINWLSASSSIASQLSSITRSSNTNSDVVATLSVVGSSLKNKTFVVSTTGTVVYSTNASDIGKVIKVPTSARGVHSFTSLPSYFKATQVGSQIVIVETSLIVLVGGALIISLILPGVLLLIRTLATFKMGVYINDNFIETLIKIQDVVEQVAEGNLSARVRSDFGVHELDLLCESFNEALSTMSVNIRKAEADKEIAESENDAKSTFLANMSHEIRTPMIGVLGFADHALDDFITEEKRLEYIEGIKTSASGLLGIINDILDISKIEAGVLELEEIPFDLTSVFESAKLVIEPKTKEKGLVLFCYTEPTPGVRLVGDPTKLRQVLVNLLSNAVKFTNSGKISMMSAVSMIPGKKAKVRFEVKDSGIGMTEDQIDKIFEPFSQADGSTTRKYGGTGLGLSITKSIVEKMGGILEVRSVKDLGSKFSFQITFPVVEVKETPKTETTKKRKFVGERPAFNGTVLVCEDNAINQKVIKAYLNKFGIEPVMASNGQEGIVEFNKLFDETGSQFDLILMDVHMPVLDGMEATERLRTIGCRSPIVMMTANVMSGFEEQYKDQGFSSYLGKPFTDEMLIDCLADYLEVTNRTSIEVVQGSAAGADSSKDLSVKSRKKEKVEIKCMDYELLHDFVTDCRSNLPAFETAMRKGDIKTAHRLAHTIKGLADLIACRRLRESAYEVEERLSAGSIEVTDEQQNEFVGLLTEVIGTIDELLAEVGYGDLGEDEDTGVADSVKPVDKISAPPRKTPAKRQSTESVPKQVKQVDSSSPIVRVVPEVDSTAKKLDDRPTPFKSQSVVSDTVVPTHVSQSKPVQKPKVPQSMVILLSRLEKMIMNEDFECLHLVVRLQDIPKTESLITCMEDSDWDGAQRELTILKARLGI